MEVLLSWPKVDLCCRCKKILPVLLGWMWQVAWAPRHHSDDDAQLCIRGGVRPAQVGDMGFEVAPGEHN